jgi:hypothetical protein
MPESRFIQKLFINLKLQYSFPNRDQSISLIISSKKSQEKDYCLNIPYVNQHGRKDWRSEIKSEFLWESRAYSFKVKMFKLKNHE